MKGNYHIDIAKDAMTVFVTVTQDGDTEITEKLLRDELSRRGVTNGIDGQALALIPIRGRFDVRYCIAKGQPAKPGRDGYYEFLFDAGADETHPSIQEDGAVDYSPTFTMATAGDCLAVYHPAEQGTFGVTVFGAPIGPVPTKEAQPIQAVGAEKRGNQYFALVDGHVAWDGHKLEVRDRLMIEGNADYSVRRITFNGDVHITGDVFTDVAIQAYGGIEVDGVVEGATLTAGKDIVIRRGVHGMGKAEINAGGTVTTTFIEEAKVIAGGNILTDHIINAKVYANDTVRAAGKSGQIIGGETSAGRLVDAYCFGNARGQNTRIVVRASEPEEQGKERVIVRRVSYSGTSVVLGEKTIPDLASKAGEFYLDGEDVKKKNVGAASRRESEKKTKEQETGAERKKTILIVDDDPIIIKTEYAYLSGGYRVIGVSQPEDALRFMQKMCPDLILLDYRMPKMTGGQLLEKIRGMKDAQKAAVPVFFVSGVTDKKVVEEVSRLYPQGYLFKPVEKDELLRIVGQFFESGGKTKA